MATLYNTDLRKGVVFKLDNNPVIVLDFKLVKQGRGSSNVRVKVKNLLTGVTVERTFGGGETVESVDLERKSAQYLYNDGSDAYFMDAQSFEQFSLPLETVESQIKFLKEGEKVIALVLDGKPVSIEIPKTVVLEVTQTSQAVKGDTATNATKDATLENGTTIKVPLFIKQGDKVKVNTDRGEYSGKA